MPLRNKVQADPGAKLIRTAGRPMLKRPKPPTPAAVWTPCRLTVQLWRVARNAYEPATVTARTFGSVAVYADVQDRGWVLMVVPVSLMIARFDAEADAFRAGELLQRRCTLALREPDPAKLRKALPVWVGPWAKAMQVLRKFEEPQIPA